jgi:hypothetical protein
VRTKQKAMNDYLSQRIRDCENTMIDSGKRLAMGTLHDPEGTLSRMRKLHEELRVLRDIEGRLDNRANGG